MPRSRDRDAMFNRTFDLHYEAVQIYCFCRLRADDVNDAVAEVFLVAWRRMGPDACWQGAPVAICHQPKHRP